MNTKIQILELIKTQLNELETINYEVELNEHILALSSMLERVYAEKSIIHKEIKRISYELAMLVTYPSDEILMGINIEIVNDSYKKLLLVIKNEIEKLGIPVKNEMKIDKSVNISVNQQQSQSIEISYILETLKDELTGKQFKEIKEISELEINDKEKKNRIFEKFKEFGFNVTTSVLSSIISNPAIWNLIS